MVSLGHPFQTRRIVNKQKEMSDVPLPSLIHKDLNYMMYVTASKRICMHWL